MENIDEVPRYITTVTIIGIFFLTVSFFTSLSLTFAFDHPENNNETFKSSTARDAAIYSTLVLAIIGFILSCFSLYGHYLKGKNDPRSIIKGPVNIVKFPSIDEEIQVNDMEKPDLKPLPKKVIFPIKNKLRADFL